MCAHTYEPPQWSRKVPVYILIITVMSLSHDAWMHSKVVLVDRWSVYLPNQERTSFWWKFFCGVSLCSVSLWLQALVHGEFVIIISYVPVPVLAWRFIYREATMKFFQTDNLIPLGCVKIWYMEWPEFHLLDIILAENSLYGHVF